MTDPIQVQDMTGWTEDEREAFDRWWPTVRGIHFGPMDDAAMQTFVQGGIIDDLDVVLNPDVPPAFFKMQDSDGAWHVYMVLDANDLGPADTNP